MKDALRIALEAIEGKKAVDVVVLDISGIASFSDYFIICSGTSSRQIQAVADEVEKRMRENGARPEHIEGYANAEWVLLDFLDFVVHVFSKSARSYYDLERLWRDGTPMDIQKLQGSSTASAGKKKPRSPSRTA